MFGRLLLVTAACVSTQAMALPFFQGRASGGYVFLEGDSGGKSGSSGTVSAAGRFGYQFDNTNYFAALDVNAFRVYGMGPLGADNDGNIASLAYGHIWPNFTLWLSGGAGELRSFDRESEKTRPYKYYITEAQLGVTFNLYTSDSARVELGSTLGRITPDAEWRQRYGLKAINSLQIDIGFKLLNW
ncbi:MAG: hypothetical protein V4655_04550 [Bdellovibrionota bacterium]